jgi:hypothetical protein
VEELLPFSVMATGLDTGSSIREKKGQASSTDRAAEKKAGHA